MVMFNETRRGKKKLMGLASALEMGMSAKDMGFMVSTAEELVKALRTNDLGLSGDEKVRLVKSVCRAKAKAFLGGPGDNYKTYRALSTISSDLVRML
jgi:hypothetical protein